MGRNTLKLQTKGIDELVDKLKKLDGDVKGAVTEALEKAGEKIGNDTDIAISKPNLPARGKYSHGATAESVIHNPPVEWKGNQASIGVGFDYGKVGAGGFLIAGTPRNNPDVALRRMYKDRKYMSDVEKEMQETIGQYITKKMR